MFRSARLNLLSKIRRGRNLMTVVFKSTPTCFEERGTDTRGQFDRRWRPDLVLGLRDRESQWTSEITIRISYGFPSVKKSSLRHFLLALSVKASSPQG